MYKILHILYTFSQHSFTHSTYFFFFNSLNRSEKRSHLKNYRTFESHFRCLFSPTSRNSFEKSWSKRGVSRVHPLAPLLQGISAYLSDFSEIRAWETFDVSTPFQDCFLMGRESRNVLTGEFILVVVECKLPQFTSIRAHKNRMPSIAHGIRVGSLCEMNQTSNREYGTFVETYRYLSIQFSFKRQGFTSE